MSININQTSLVSQDSSSLSALAAERKTARVEAQATPTVQVRSDVVTLSAGKVDADVSQTGQSTVSDVVKGKKDADAVGGKTLPPDESVIVGTTAEGDKEQITAAVERLNDFVQDMKRELNFSYDDEIGMVVVKVVESATDEVIRQIPSEEAVKMAQSLQDLREGGLFEAKA